MPVIVTYGLIDISGIRPGSVDFTPSIDSFIPVNNTPPWEVYSPEILSGAVFSSLPIQEVEENSPGYRMPTFLDDYYNRIHIIPNEIALGNLLSSQSRNVEVWNSYLADKLLSSIGQTGTDGITLVQPQVPPTTFNSLESRTYQLNVSTNGSPVIDAVYTFNFPGDSPTLRVTGRRVVVWPWMPQINHDEGMEWKTDILQTFNNEQRLALREAPRQDFTLTFQLDNEQFSKAKAIATQWAQRVYGIPVWSELTRLGPLSSGAEEVFFDTSNADYRDNDIVIIWESDVKFVAIEILEVLSDRINLKLPLEDNYSNAYIAPLRFARTYQGMNFKRSPHDIIIASSTFTVTQNKDLGASVGYIQYRSRDVLLEPLLALSDMSERISRSLDLFDNGSGVVVVDINSQYVRSTKSVVFDTLDRVERWKARKWIHSRRGKQKSFWIPSWNHDLILLEDAGSTATSITVRSIGYSLYYGVTDIMIRRKDGTQVFARVLGASTDVSGNELLNLEAQLGSVVSVLDVDFISFMSLVRFDSDSIKLKHSYSGRATTTIPVVEVPE